MTFNVYLNNGLPYKETTKLSVFTHLASTWAVARAYNNEERTPEQFKKDFLRDARAELSQCAMLAMLRDDSEFFRNLANAMDERRKGRSIADPVRLALWSLVNTVRIDHEGNIMPSLTNEQIAEILQEKFPKIDERHIRRIKKELRPLSWNPQPDK